MVDFSFAGLPPPANPIESAWNCHLSGRSFTDQLSPTLVLGHQRATLKPEPVSEGGQMNRSACSGEMHKWGEGVMVLGPASASVSNPGTNLSADSGVQQARSTCIVESRRASYVGSFRTP